MHDSGIAGLRQSSLGGQGCVPVVYYGQREICGKEEEWGEQLHQLCRGHGRVRQERHHVAQLSCGNAVGMLWG